MAGRFRNRSLSTSLRPVVAHPTRSLPGPGSVSSRPLLRRLTKFALAALLLGLPGCALTFDAHTLGANVTVAQVPDSTQCVAPFRQSKKAVFFFWGLLAGSRPSLEHVLEGQVTGKQSVGNLRIHVRSRFTDLLVTAITGGLIVPRSVTFNGCVLGP